MNGIVIQLLGIAFSISFSVVLSYGGGLKSLLRYYVVVSLPVIQTLSFLCNPPPRSGVPVMFIVWSVVVVLYLGGTFWKHAVLGIGVHRGKGSKNAPLPIIILMLFGFAYLGVLMFTDMPALFILWIFGSCYTLATMNKKLYSLVELSVNWLPELSGIVYVIQCRDIISLVYSATIVLVWRWYRGFPKNDL